MRMQAEDLIAAVFPDQIACAENLVGEREVPDHPLTNQTISDCLSEAMDVRGLERLLARLETGAIRVVACDLTQPSPLALDVSGGDVGRWRGQQSAAFMAFAFVLIGKESPAARRARSTQHRAGSAGFLPFRDRSELSGVSMPGNDGAEADCGDG